MGRRGVWRRRLSRAGATLLIGGFIGFLVPSIVADLSPKPEAQARTAESPVARQFITAYVADDQATLDLLGVAAAVKAKSARVKAEYLKVDAPIHLGSWVIGNGLAPRICIACRRQPGRRWPARRRRGAGRSGRVDAAVGDDPMSAEPAHAVEDDASPPRPQEDARRGGGCSAREGHRDRGGHHARGGEGFSGGRAAREAESRMPRPNRPPDAPSADESIPLPRPNPSRHRARRSVTSEAAADAEAAAAVEAAPAEPLQPRPSTPPPTR